MLQRWTEMFDPEKQITAADLVPLYLFSDPPPPDSDEDDDSAAGGGAHHLAVPAPGDCQCLAERVENAGGGSTEEDTTQERLFSLRDTMVEPVLIQVRTTVCPQLLFAINCLPSNVCPQLFALNYCLPSTNLLGDPLEGRHRHRRGEQLLRRHR